MNFKVNVNEYVKVKLTAVGIEILETQNNELNEMLKRNNSNMSRAFKLKVDDDGYSRFQIWDFMNTFGEYMTLGAEMPFDSEIIVTNGKLIE